MGHVLEAGAAVLSEISEGSIVSDDLRTLDGSSFDGEPRLDGLYEERFRVDRRKLESMLTAPVEGTSEVAAEKFFQRVMEETGTIITWPLKLKVGSKSKRDPHVRVAGDPEKVHEAKERVMAVLDTRQSNRVTMKIEVSFTDHSHIIGRGGRTISKVMEDTKCHVHFPDSNRTNTMEKSNQVSIAGELPGVEEARAQVRELMPLVVLFEPPIIGAPFQQFPELDSPFVQQLQEQHKVQITFRPRSRGPRPGIVSVKGCESEVPALKKAVNELVNLFCGPSTGVPSVYVNLEISPQHHYIVQGAQVLNLRCIQQTTNTSIVFPDLSDPSIPSLRKNTVSIRGSLDDVLRARHLLIGSLPLLLMFDVREEAEPDPTMVARLMSALDVNISIRPKPKQTIKSVVIRGYERNATNIYEARRLLLGLDRDSRIIAAVPESYMIKSDLGISFRNTLNYATSSGTPQPIYSTGYPLISSAGHGYHGNHGYHAAHQFRKGYGPNRYNSAYGSYGYPGYAESITSDFRSGSNTRASSSGMSSPYESSTPTPLCDYISTDIGMETRPRDSLNDFYTRQFPMDKSALPDEYQDKQFLAYHAMRQQPMASRPRVPTGLWAGYGFSQSARSPGNPEAALIGNPLLQADDQISSPWEGTPAAHKPMPKLIPSVSNGLDAVSSLPPSTLPEPTDLPSLLHKYGLPAYIVASQTLGALMTSTKPSSATVCEIKLLQNAYLFQKNEIDLEVFRTLTEKDLQTLGLNKFGVRRKLLLAIADLNRRSAPFCAAPGAERRGSAAPVKF